MKKNTFRTPSIGQIVHFVPMNVDTCQAAIIVGVEDEEKGVVNLVVFFDPPETIFDSSGPPENRTRSVDVHFRRVTEVPWSGFADTEFWHWPERVGL